MIVIGLMLIECGSSAFAASATITGVNQRPWIIKDNGVLKSETTLAIGVQEGPAFDAWVKISVTGKTDYMESLGNLSAGKTNKVVHVLELNKDGDNVTFALFDTPMESARLLTQRPVPSRRSGTGGFMLATIRTWTLDTPTTRNS